MENDLMMPAEVGEQLHMSVKTLANQRSRREGPPYVKLSGGRVRYSRKALAKWLDERTVSHGGQPA